MARKELILIALRLEMRNLFIDLSLITAILHFRF